MSESNKHWLVGSNLDARRGDFSDSIAYEDHKIRFVVNHSRGKRVLDLGCVHHNPENYKSKFWVHRALTEVAATLEGLDLYEPGVGYLRDRGFKVSLGDAQRFNLNSKFDVVVACDLIEHLEDLSGFLESCKNHLVPRGKLLISTPNSWYWRNVIKAAIFRRVSVNPEHTLWMCPVTLQQLVSRHGMKVTSVTFGSRYFRDRAMPLPVGVKHTSFHAVIERSN